MDRRPDVTVKLMMRVDSHIFILLHRANGAYDFPGGRMEWGESPETALVRELHEELGYVLTAEPAFFGIWNYVSEDKNRHSLQLQYLVILPERPDFNIAEDADGLWLDKVSYLKKVIRSAERVERMFA